jgi:hypothetical protein
MKNGIATTAPRKLNFIIRILGIKVGGLAGKYMPNNGDLGQLKKII